MTPPNLYTKRVIITGVDCTSFWIVPDFVALQTGIPGLISKSFANENHFTSSAWRRALRRGTKFAMGTNVDAYYVARDNYVDIIFENVGPPSCANHTKYEDAGKSCRNAACGVPT
ncbi:hypothetical protein EDD21DRAFT_349661 [Dissophora ornata]|nr:hypothetical protein EDD21DRAFT_349661 [Dissophora ornata]